MLVVVVIAGVDDNDTGVDGTGLFGSIGSFIFFFL